MSRLISLSGRQGRLPRATVRGSWSAWRERCRGTRSATRPWRGPALRPGDSAMDAALSNRFGTFVNKRPMYDHLVGVDRGTPLRRERSSLWASCGPMHRRETDCPPDVTEASRPLASGAGPLGARQGLSRCEEHDGRTARDRLANFRWLARPLVVPIVGALANALPEHNVFPMRWNASDP